MFLVQQGFNPKSFDELLRRLNRRIWNYASGNARTKTAGPLPLEDPAGRAGFIESAHDCWWHYPRATLPHYRRPLPPVQAAATASSYSAATHRRALSDRDRSAAASRRKRARRRPGTIALDARAVIAMARRDLKPLAENRCKAKGSRIPNNNRCPVLSMVRKQVVIEVVASVN